MRDGERGFALVELMLVVGIISILASIAASVGGLTFGKNQLALETDHLTNTIRLAQAYSVAGREDDTWGVYVEPTFYSLFKGSDYASRDVAFDLVHGFPSGVIAGGLSEVVFDFRTGTTADAGAITLIQDVNGDMRSITINAQGRITDI